MKSARGVFGENPHHAAFEVLRNDGSGVATPAVEPIEFTTIGAELDRAGRPVVLRADPAEEGPFTVRAALQIFDIAVFGVTHGEAHAKLLVSEIAGDTLVQLKQRAFASRNVHAVDIEVTLVPRIVRDQQFTSA